MKKTCILIAGPTAVGKTALAIELAKHFSSEIISADSRQCYREMNIGVAKPDASELASVPHHFINSHSIHQTVTAADFEKEALQISSDLFTKTDVVIVAGGTGLYLKAFARGLDPLPSADPVTRKKVEEGYASGGGLSWLQQQIRAVDPAFVASGEMENPRRLMRALEVFFMTGRSILSFHSHSAAVRDFNIIPLRLDMPREQLYDRIHDRVDKMIRQGLESEARELFPFRHLPALQTVGYNEFFSFFSGEIVRERAIDLIRQNTRHYAKRQMTWFRNQDDYIACPAQASDMIRIVEDKMGEIE